MTEQQLDRFNNHRHKVKIILMHFRDVWSYERRRFYPAIFIKFFYDKNPPFQTYDISNLSDDFIKEWERFRGKIRIYNPLLEYAKKVLGSDI